MQTTFSKSSFLGAALGTMIEYYDYALFVIFLPVISPIFFPADTLAKSIQNSYWIWLITMIIRPLGGIGFGYLGDILGRKKALLNSMYGIALSTFVIGMTPSYATIGIWAIILITVAKSVQVFCFGGEYNGAGIYVVEHAQNNREALIGSLLTSMMLFGSLLASLLGVFFTASFMPEWSWRIAFLLGGLIGVFGILYRKNLYEPPHFKQADSHRHTLGNLLKQYPRELLTGIFIGGFATVPFTTVLTFINPMLMAKGFFTKHELMWLQSLIILIAVIALVLAGLFADKHSPKKVMRIGCILLMICSYPLLLLTQGQVTVMGVIIAEAVIVIINEILLGPSNAYLKSLFPMEYRYRGASFSFCVGMSLLGGLTPLIENYIYQMTGHMSNIAIWLAFVGLGTFLSMGWVERKRNQMVLAVSSS
jgi:MHS family proline/betaine transporter-like MFS transporter